MKCDANSKKSVLYDTGRRGGDNLGTGFVVDCLLLGLLGGVVCLAVHA